MPVHQKTDEFIKMVFDSFPEDLRKTRDDFEKNLRAALSSAFSSMNLVTREEFDVQSALLTRTRELVQELEDKVSKLEKELASDE